MNSIKFLFFALLFIQLFPTKAVLAEKFGKTIKIGIITDGYEGYAFPLADAVEMEIKKLLGNRYKIEIKQTNVLSSNWEISQAERNYNILLNDPDIEIIIGLGILSSDAISRKAPYQKPVIASLIFDHQLQNLPKTKDGESGIHNYNYVLAPYDPKRDLEVFHELFPYQHVVLLMGDNVMSGLPAMNEYFDNVCTNLGVKYTDINIRQDVQASLQAIPVEGDAVYFGPLFFLKTAKQRTDLINGVNAMKLPSFALQGKEACELGILASIAPTSNFTRISRRIALNLEQILDGRDPGDLSVEMDFIEELTINMETARSIGFAPSFDFAAQATLINDGVKNVVRSMTLISAIHEALDNNWDLTVVNKDVFIAQQTLGEARSQYLPQIGASTTGLIIDEDRAAASFGSQPQFSGTATGSASQLIYSDQVNSQNKITRRQLQAIEHARDAIEMDVVLSTAERYLNVLRAKTTVRIQNNNLNLTRRNLELARVRQDIGYSGPSDLYRWQSEIAVAKSNLLESKATQRIAEIALNEVLGYPIDDNFITEEVGIDDPYIITNDERMFNYIDNEIVYGYYADFMVSEAMKNLPELMQASRAIEIQDRLVSQFRRSFFLPEIGVQGGMNYIYFRDGAGATPSIPAIPDFPTVDDLTWNAGVTASLPIFTGGFRLNQLQKSKIALMQSKDEQIRLKQRLEQRVRTNIELIAVSYTNIGLSKEAEEAAKKNFELVQDAYSNGLVSIIQLIDAQNAAIRSEQFAANSVYEFVIDLLNIERSAGIFYSLSTKATRDEYFDRLNDFIIDKSNY